MVTQTVILAAGVGARLDGSGGVPKPLVPVAGQPLIAHALAHAIASGCTRATVVVGHEGGRVRRAIEALDVTIDIRFVETPDPLAPNGHSLLAAEPAAGPQFFLQMVDHVFAETMLPALAAGKLGGGVAGRVLVDRAPVDLDLDDATRVRLDGEVVTAIGKRIEPWDAIDAGCFVLTHDVFDALRQVPSTEPLTVSSGMRRLVAAGRLCATDTGGVRWVDVDTAVERAAAERLLAGRPLDQEAVP